MDDPKELEWLKNYKPSIDDLQMKKPDKFWRPPTVKQRIEKILNDDTLSVHPSRLEDYQNREAIRLLAEQIDTIWAIVKAYKMGQL